MKHQYLFYVMLLLFLLNTRDLFCEFNGVQVNNDFPPSDTVREAWKLHYENSAYLPQDESATQVAVDARGYVFAAGDGGIKRYDPDGNEVSWPSDGYMFALDHAKYHIYIVRDDYYGSFPLNKYDLDGNLIWQRYPGGEISKILLDNDGCILVTAMNWNWDNTDWTTTKYDSNGILQWSTSHQIGLSEEEPLSLTTDPRTGYVFVTGHSLTIKYDLNGQITSTYDLGGRIIKCDDSGNIYLATSDRLLKLDSSFTLIWDDSASINDITLDDRGNIYTTGDSGTRKLSPNGTIIWDNAMKGRSIVVDDSLDVFTIGTYSDSITGSDYQTIKYDSNGVAQWDALYDGPLNGTDDGYSLILDSLGNVYVTGGSAGLDGTSDYLTIKYTQDGNEDWLARFGSSEQIPSSATAQALALDNFGNVTATGNDATIQYSPSGSQNWFANTGLTNQQKMFGYGRVKKVIAIDDTGNVYLTGLLNDSMKTMKYTNSGDHLWTATFQGRLVDPYALAVDNKGNVVVIGMQSIQQGIGYDRDILTVKYNSVGEQQWIATYDGPSEGFSNDIPRALAIDNSGNIYVTGYSDSLTSDYLTIKYSPDGDLEWFVRYDAGDIDEAVDIALDQSGNVYVTGSSYDSLTLLDYVTISYTPEGTERWISRYEQQWTCEQLPDSLRWLCDSLGWSDAALHDMATALAVDKDNNIYVTGTMPISNKESVSYHTVKYNSSGIQQWVTRYSNWFLYGGTLDTVWEYPNSIVTDNAGNIYVSGECYHGGSSRWDFLTVKYTPDGMQKWVAITDGIANSQDRHAGIVVAPSGDVYVAGTSEYGNSSIYTIIKYEQIPTSVSESQVIPTSYKLEQNYPNPFNPSTTIRYELPKASFVTLKVYNVLGQEVVTLVDEKREAGRYEVEFNSSKLSSGLYFYRLVAGDYMAVKKFLLLK